jgi:hypothetical protein
MESQLKEILQGLDGILRRLEARMNTLFLFSGSEPLPPRERVERAIRLIRFSSDIVAALERMMDRLSATIERTREEMSRYAVRYDLPIPEAA